MALPLEDVARPEGPTFARVVAEYPTPVYVHDLAVLRDRAARLRGALPADSTLLYSLKANPLAPVVGAVQSAGCGSEVSSPGELAVALGTGVAPGPLLYTGPGKAVAEIRAALAAGAVLSCESAAEVRRVRAVAGDARPGVLLRVQLPARSSAGLSMADGRQFGFLEQEAVELCRSGPGVDVLGFHCYAGSQLPDREALLEMFAHTVATMLRLADAGGVRLRAVDLGGGFPWPYAMPGAGPDLGPLAGDLAGLLEPLRERGAEVFFESGRSLVAAASTLLTTVVDVKRRSGRTFVVVDAGVNVLGGMSGLGRVLRPSVTPRNLTGGGGDEAAVDIVGPLCTPLDRLSAGTRMPEPAVGDVLAVDNVGAYGATAALTGFLSRPAPAEVVVDGARVVGAWRLNSGHVAL